MSNKVIRLDTLKKNVYDINKYDPDYMFNLKAFVNYAIKLYNSNILDVLVDIRKEVSYIIKPIDGISKICDTCTNIYIFLISIIINHFFNFFI